MGWREIELDGWIHTSSSGQLMTVCSFDRHLNLSMLFYVMGSGLKCNWMAQKSWRPPAPWSAWKCFDESQYSVFHHTATLSVGMVLIVRIIMTMMTIGWWGVVGGQQMAMTMLIVMIMVSDHDNDDGDDGSWGKLKSQTEMEMTAVCISCWWFMLFELEQVNTLL